MSDIIRRHVGPRLSQAVEHNGVVYLAGQVGDDQDADVATQTKQILAKIDRLFAECGTNKSKLLWAQLWVKEARRRRRTADSNRIPPPLCGKPCPAGIRGLSRRRTKKARYSIARLPARDDPMVTRVDLIRGRDGMFIDTLNVYYNDFYAQTQESYAAWRSQDYWERETIKSARGSSRLGRGGGGPWVGVGPVCITPSDFRELGSDDSDRRTKKDPETHIAALRELGASLARGVAPLLVEVEGEVLRLTGSVETQCASWCTLLREIFAAETGLPVVTRPESTSP